MVAWSARLKRVLRLSKKSHGQLAKYGCTPGVGSHHRELKLVQFEGPSWSKGRQNDKYRIRYWEGHEQACSSRAPWPVVPWDLGSGPGLYLVFPCWTGARGRIGGERFSSPGLPQAHTSHFEYSVPVKTLLSMGCVSGRQGCVVGMREVMNSGPLGSSVPWGDSEASEHGFDLMPHPGAWARVEAEESWCRLVLLKGVPCAGRNSGHGVRRWGWPLALPVTSYVTSARPSYLCEEGLD